MGNTAQAAPVVARDFKSEFIGIWNEIPDKGVAGVLLLAWALLFQWLGSSTFGHIDSPSLFVWLWGNYNSELGDDQHGFIVPLIVLFLLWGKRAQWRAVPKAAAWWPLVFLAAGVVFHLAGFLLQQQRLSVVGFFSGVFGILGTVWGGALLRAIFFPYVLFAFSVPIGQLSQSITFPLRILVTKAAVWFSSTLLGIGVVREGTFIRFPSLRYVFDVAPACSGIRSLISIFLFAVIYGVLSFQSPWKRATIVALALPFAVAGNIVRLITAMIIADGFGAAAGKWAETKLGFITFALAIGGVLLAGRFLRGRPAEKEGP